MTHFAVAVITDGTKTADELLAPYQENNMGTCPREYLDFFDMEDEYLQQYENDSANMAKMPDGRLLYPWDEQFRKKGKLGFGSGAHEVPEDIPVIRVPFKEKYATFEEFVKDWHGVAERDPEMGRYGYFENSSAKYDWYQIGGRWHGMLRASEGILGEPSWCNESVLLPAGRFDAAKIRDIDFDPDQDAYKRAIAEWEYNVEGKGDDESLKWCYSTDYMIKHYGSKETYAKVQSTVFWRAVVTPNGEWHEVGSMGWWGCSSETGSELVDWALHFGERFITPCNPEHVLHVVDIHIWSLTRNRAATQPPCCEGAGWGCLMAAIPAFSVLEPAVFLKGSLVKHQLKAYFLFDLRASGYRSSMSFKSEPTCSCKALRTKERGAA